MAEQQLSQILSKLEKLNKLDSIESKLESLQTNLTALTGTVQQLQTSVTANTAANAETRSELAAFKEETSREIRALKTTLNRREQQLRATTIRVFHFPTTPGESIENYKNLANRVYDRILRPLMAAAKSGGDLGVVPQIQNTVESCYRVYQGQQAQEGPPPPVIVRLKDNNIKHAIMKYRRRHTPLPSEAEQAAGTTRFVIVEELTPPAHKLMQELKKNSRVEKVWSVNGQLHYTGTGRSGYIKVRSVFDSIETILSSNS